MCYELQCGLLLLLWCFVFFFTSFFRKTHQTKLRRSNNNRNIVFRVTQFCFFFFFVFLIFARALTSTIYTQFAVAGDETKALSAMCNAEANWVTQWVTFDNTQTCKCANEMASTPPAVDELIFFLWKINRFRLCNTQHAMAWHDIVWYGSESVCGAMRLSTLINDLWNSISLLGAAIFADGFFSDVRFCEECEA